MPRKKATDKPVNQRTQAPAVPIPTISPFSGPNTITLSTDMSMIYLIDSGRAIPFSLDTIGGVLIGEVRGQITVVSALEPKLPKDEPIGSKKLETFSAERAVGIPVVKAARIPTNRGSWTFIHIRDQRKLCVIGVVDIDSSLTEDQALQAAGYLFDLREGFLNVQKVGNTLVFETLSANL